MFVSLCCCEKRSKRKNERKKMHSWFYLSMDLGLKFSLIFFVYPIFVWDLVFRRNFNLVFVTKKKKTIFQLILCHQLFVQIKKNSKEKEIYTLYRTKVKQKSCNQCWKTNWKEKRIESKQISKWIDWCKKQKRIFLLDEIVLLARYTTIVIVWWQLLI